VNKNTTPDEQIPHMTADEAKQAWVEKTLEDLSALITFALAIPPKRGPR